METLGELGLSLKQTAAPAEEPVTLVEAKAQLRVVTADDDTHITRLTKVARERVEAMARRQLVTATYELTLDRFPVQSSTRYVSSYGRVLSLDPILLPRPPIQSVTKVEYYDEANVKQTWAATKWQADLRDEPGRLLPVEGESWPTTKDRLGAVIVTYVAGYGAASAVPEVIKQAILLIVAELYERREEAVIGTIVSPAVLAAERLLETERVARF